MKYPLKVKDFLALSQEEQNLWIEKNINDYELKLYGDGYVGCFYPDDVDWDEHLNDPENFGVAGLIVSQHPSITDERIEEINSGAQLTAKEKEHLFAAIAEKDVDNWITHNSFEIEMSDGRVFVYFHGHIMGQGGFNFEYQKAFDSYKALLREVSSFPLSSID